MIKHDQGDIDRFMHHVDRLCREGVIARRAAQGNHEPLPERFEDGLKGNDVRAANYAFKMKQAGAPVYKVSRDEARVKLEELTA